MMNCTQDKERLSAWHDGVLPEADRATVAAHLDACAECRAVVDEYRAIGETLRALPREKAPASILQAVQRSASAPNEIPFPQRSAISYVLAAAAALLIAVNVLVYFNNAPDQTPDTPAEVAGAYDRDESRREKAPETKRAELERDFAESDSLNKQVQEDREAEDPMPPARTEAPKDAGLEPAVESRVLYLALQPEGDRKLKDKADADLSEALDGYRTRGRVGAVEKELEESAGEKPAAARPDNADDLAEELADENRKQRRVGGRATEAFTIEVTEEEYAALTRLASSEGALVAEDAMMALGAFERAEEKNELDQLAQGFVRQLRELEQSKRESADAPAEHAVPQAERAAKGFSGGDEGGRTTDPAKAKEARWIRVTVYLLSREELLRRAHELEKQQPTDDPK